jgi:hypothetical protein
LAVLFTLQAPAVAQARNNDGFHRVNGQMHVLRNGQLRPMTRDARLPTGVVVTKDGFLVAADGSRTELREGQGCDLRGRVVPVASVAGGLALGAPAPQQRAAARSNSAQVRSVLEELLGGRRGDDERDEDRYEGDKEYDKKVAEQMREQRKKEEEWLREEGKRQEEHGRGRDKKWKEKGKKGKKWDD